jgi:hypothetical protein
MGAWVITTPVGTESANTTHTLIQAAKTDLMDRLVANDGTIDTHSFKGSSATGLHAISQTGWVKSHTSYTEMLVWIAANAPKDGTLQVIGTSLYVMHNGAPALCASSDHGELSNLTGDTGHTQYIATSGSRPMSGNLTMDSATSITWDGIGETEEGQPMAATHVAKSWYDAHGANCLLARHFGTDILPSAQLKTTAITGSAAFSGTFAFLHLPNVVMDTPTVRVQVAAASVEHNADDYWGYVLNIHSMWGIFATRYTSRHYYMETATIGGIVRNVDLRAYSGTYTYSMHTIGGTP